MSPRCIPKTTRCPSGSTSKTGETWPSIEENAGTRRPVRSGAPLEARKRISGLERQRDLARDRQRVGRGNAPARDQIRERRALDELHHNRIAALEAVHLGDVGVIELGENLRLALESREAVGVVGDRGWEHFDRDVATKTGIAGPINFAHAARAQRREDFVVPEARPGGQWHRRRRF
jgi:hypothetical protein